MSISIPMSACVCGCGYVRLYVAFLAQESGQQALVCGRAHSTMATVFPASQAIVVGGGLAGMTAANTVLECGGSVTLIDKSPYCGGNSTKASSGISAANTRTQRMKDIFDSAESFVEDAKYGKGTQKIEVVQVLAANSGKDVEWLMDKFGLDLSLVTRLAGHSEARTHRGPE